MENVSFRDLVHRSAKDIFDRAKDHSKDPDSYLNKQCSLFDEGFTIDELLPEGWVVTRDQETRLNKGKSLEGFLEYFYKYEWKCKGVVDKRNPQYPYNQYKLVEILKYVLGVQMHLNGEFIQHNRYNKTRRVGNLGNTLMMYFTVLRNYSRDERYGTKVDIFQKIFDNSLWCGSKYRECPQLAKPILIKHETAQWKFAGLNNGSTAFAREIITYNRGQYGTSTYIQEIITEEDVLPDMELNEAIHELIAKHRKDKFVSNAEIFELITKYDDTKSKRACGSYFDMVAQNMNVKCLKTAFNNVRGRKLIFYKLKETKVSTKTFGPSLEDKK